MTDDDALDKLAKLDVYFYRWLTMEKYKLDELKPLIVKWENEIEQRRARIYAQSFPTQSKAFLDSMKEE